MTVQTLPRPLAPRPPFAPQRDENGDIIYPETDFVPMVWNTIHYRWLTFLKDGFEQYFSAQQAKAADDATQRLERLTERLRAAGIDPDAI